LGFICYHSGTNISKIFLNEYSGIEAI